MEDQQEPQAGADQSGTPARKHVFLEWYLVLVLGLVNALSQADRAGLNLIVNPLKRDLGVSDTQISLLIGLSFIVLFTVLSVPAGYLADILNRRKLLGGAVVLWSAMVTLCGFAKNYWQLFAGRMGLGVGESPVAPASYSLIGDGVGPARRVRAFAAYNAMGVIGTSLGTLAGGAVYGAAEHGMLAGVPVLADLKPWQLVLVIPGLFGFLLAALLLTISEPKRRDVAGSDRASYIEALRYTLLHRRRYLPIFASFVLVCLASGGWHAWIAAAIGRSWQLSPAVIGRTAGSIGLLLSPLPAFLLAYVMDIFKSRGHNAAPPLVAAVVCAANGASALLVLLAPTVWSMWMGYGVWCVLSYTVVGNVCGMMLVEITPSHLVGKVASIYFLCAYFLGATPGPTLFALVAQYGFRGPSAISQAILVCYPLVIVLTIAALLAAALEIGRYKARLNAVPK